MADLKPLAECYCAVTTRDGDVFTVGSVVKADTWTLYMSDGASLWMAKRTKAELEAEHATLTGRAGAALHECVQCVASAFNASAAMDVKVGVARRRGGRLPFTRARRPSQWTPTQCSCSSGRGTSSSKCR